MDHVAPRPKRLNGDSSKLSVVHHPHPQTLQNPLIYPHHFSDLEMEKNPRSQYNSMHRLPTSYQHNQSFNEQSSADKGQQNLRNVFFKNYPEFFHCEKYKKKRLQTLNCSAHKINNSLSNVQLPKDIEHDYQPTYAMVRRTSPPLTVPNTSLLSTNPFLTSSNFKKYNTVGEELIESMPRGKTSKATLVMEKKFYSLKFSSGNKIKKKACNVKSSLDSTKSPFSSHKCKTNHYIAGNRHYLIEPTSQPMRHYDSPDYENMVINSTADQDTVNLDGGRSNQNSIPNLATVQLRALPIDIDETAVVQQKKQHQHRYHQQKKNALCAESCAEFPLMEPECISIYRSDSGISNSSYESQLPATLSQLFPSKKITADSSGLICRKPVYINIEAQNSILKYGDLTQENVSYRSSLTKRQSEVKVIVNEPASLSSCAPIYKSSCADTAALEKVQAVERNMSTPDTLEQYQLGDQLARSESTSSVTPKRVVGAIAQPKFPEVSNHYEVGINKMTQLVI